MTDVVDKPRKDDCTYYWAARMSEGAVPLATAISFILSVYAGMQAEVHRVKLRWRSPWTGCEHV